MLSAKASFNPRRSPRRLLHGVSQTLGATGRSSARDGRMGWQKAVNYGRRSSAETAVLRTKAIIGRGLHARNLPAQKTEIKVACSVLSRMTRLDMPVSRHIA